MTKNDASSQPAIPALIEGASDFRIQLMLLSLEHGLAQLEYEPTQVVSSFPGEALGVGSDQVLAWSEQTEISEARLGGRAVLELAKALLHSAWEVEALRTTAEVAIRHPEDDRLSGNLTLKVGTLWPVDV